ncbi:MAG: UDP-N-acetylmuramoyl-L-alanine--D-glutamate ligase [Bacteroides sp.]
METKGKRLVVLGAGESGIGAAILGAREGYHVLVSDSGVIAEQRKAELEANAIAWEENGHTLERLLEAELVVKSPGIPANAPVVSAVRGRGIPVIGEIEFASRYTYAKLVCITGSNGKTTTTSLIHHIMQKAGLDAALAGNIGASFARLVAQGEHAYYVLEISSFQLDDMYDFKADVAVLLNITPDHLDRYDHQMANYVRAKFRIAQNMTSADSLVYCADDAETMNYLKDYSLGARLLSVSQRVANGQAAYLGGHALQFAVPGVPPFGMAVDELSLRGRHNVYNALAAGVATLVLGVPESAVREGLMDFKGIAHRLEFVRSVGGVAYINDSKATNIDSAWYGLDSVKGDVIWIAGGTDKGNDYRTLLPLVREKVRGIVCLTTDSSKLHACYDDVVPQIVDAHSASDAVKAAQGMAKAGDTVLLSPACASFDLFKNYEDRGDQFKRCVMEL